MDPYKAMLAFIYLQILDIGSAQDNCVFLREGEASPTEQVSPPVMNWYETPSVVPLSPECTGEHALGMQSGRITRQQLSASSQWDKYHSPGNGRLHFVADRGQKGSWVAKTEDQYQWFQVDFGRNVKITKFATQGRQDAGQWITKYKLKYSVDGNFVFQTYQEQGGVDKIFEGNTDYTSVVTHPLAAPITARYIQIRPVEYHKRMSMRTEFYGCVLSDRYRVLGRTVHMEYVEEHLRTGTGTSASISFADTQDRPNNIDLEVLADTIYVKTAVKMRGIKKLTMISRKVSFLQGSKLDLRAPDIPQNNPIQIAGQLVLTEIMEWTAQQQPNVDINDCPTVAVRDSSHAVVRCRDITGAKGEKGGKGENGGYAGRSGNGGNAGRQTIHINHLGNIDLKTCRGTGGEAPINGREGPGGPGGPGGLGLSCEPAAKCQFGPSVNAHCEKVCRRRGQPRGPQGDNGDPGHRGDALLVPGTNGQVEQSYLTKQSLGTSGLSKYPLDLIEVMTRFGEDRIWANDVHMAESVLNFVVTLTQGREDAAAIRKFAKHRLAFLNKPGFDRFGRNVLFAPLMKWHAFRDTVVQIRDYARDYETAYNTIQASIERRETTKQILQALPQSAEIQVKNEKERLIEARRVALTEKNAYVPAIKELEASMESNLDVIIRQIPQVHESASFDRPDVFAILQAVTGFASAAAEGDVLAAVDTAIGLAEHYLTKCITGTLEANLAKVKKWMSFGKAYRALEDSSELDFEQMDVEAVPEVMMANLEMNKESLAAGLTCMLEEQAPINVAQFKAQMENYFIQGAARIDLIAKVIDLDNEIGGYNFDIPNLEGAENELLSLRSIGASPIEENVEQRFLDDLLTTYKQMETSFSKQLYLFYKSFDFRTLWDETARLTSFERTASEAAAGTGQLQGVVQLNNALLEIDDLESRSRQCFTRFLSINDAVHKWSFNNVNDPVLFQDLHQGKANLLLGLEESCPTCYNVRVLKMYVELFGDNTQEENGLPSIVHLRVRHGGSSYFKDGNGNIKQFHQKLADSSWRKITFDRFSITNEDKCSTEREKGNGQSLFCMRVDDDRFKSMCCDDFSGTPCNEAQSGSAECQSLFGTYNIEIPINENGECDGTHITNENCKDFDRSIYTNMNVWFRYKYWDTDYPTGVDDARCSTQGKKREGIHHIGVFHKRRLSLKHQALNGTHKNTKG